MIRGMRCSGHRAGSPEQQAAGRTGIGRKSDLMAFDVAAVRAAYPALADGYAYLDGAAGTQVPSVVIEAISKAQAAGLGNAGGAFPASARSDAITDACRAAVAALVGGQASGVILGPNMTTLTYRLAGAL